ncbi:MAG: RNA-binding transcriptional accessory protein [Kiritimatiellae bacterium]|nr:RNA-binding transcriptional accessory protein [Kiritimatiellia bacterium]
MENKVALAKISAELSIRPECVAAVAKLLSEGCTVPFIARYRKEAHGNLDEVQITKIQERRTYFTELLERKEAILKSIDDQGKLTDSLREKIDACWQKSALEDLYQPYKPKRRTRAQTAKEKGYEPLADAIWNGTWGNGKSGELENATEEDLQYARDILAERIADIADVRGLVRTQFATNSMVKSEVASPKPKEPTKFEQYYEFSEPISQIPSHRYLAIRRGQAEKVLWVRLELDPEPILARMAEIISAETGDVNDNALEQIELASCDAYKRLLAPSCEIDATVSKKTEADRDAIEVFGENLRNLLLAPPLGGKAVLAIDPGIRTGCKVAMIDKTGKYVGKAVIYPQQKAQEAMKAIAFIVSKYRPEAVAVGNGTAGRETEAFVRETLKTLKAQHPEIPSPTVVSVSEAGASVYSASEIARKEFPDLDLTVRGAISIGRRLQDPLAELVKIDPKAIGVGQYQHDVQQTLLGTKLNDVVVSCVNGVGVELNTASAPLLERVSGLTPALAQAIVAWRDENGGFTKRDDLKKVKGLGPKAYEQCAGFLRIRGAQNPLDASAVHPERYELVERMAKDAGLSVTDLVGNAVAAKKIDIRKYITSEVGEPTLKDIIAELVKPGRDPRKSFEPPKFRDDVTKIEDVREGMKLEGVVTNVTAFGAFVDIGVHQDGLVHLSELSDNYVSDPSSVVKAGDRLNVTVIGIDLARGRISLSAKSKPTLGVSGGGSQAGGGARQRERRTTFAPASSQGFSCNPFANL